MNKRTIIGLAGLCAMAVLSASALAQGGPGQGGPGGPPPMQSPGMRRMDSRLMLIQMKSVQQELKLTQDQLVAIQKIQPPMIGGGGPGGPPAPGQGRPPRGGQGGQGGPPQGGFGPGGGGPPQGGFDGPMPAGPLDEILSETQLHRLKQLQLQFDAPMSMLDPRSGETLKLSEAQRQKLDEIIQAAFPRRMGPPPPGGPGQAGPGQRGPAQVGPGQGGPGQPGQGQGPAMSWQERQAKKAAAYKQALGVLSESQRAAWKALTGAEFTKWEEVRMGPPPGQRGGPPPAP